MFEGGELVVSQSLVFPERVGCESGSEYVEEWVRSYGCAHTAVHLISKCVRGPIWAPRSTVEKWWPPPAITFTIPDLVS